MIFGGRAFIFLILHSGDRELDFWAIKFTFGLNVKTGNDAGVLTETINNNRLNASHNIYATRYFFYTPVFAEYYRDPFQNIGQRITAGIGLGYTIFDTAGSSGM